MIFYVVPSPAPPPQSHYRIFSITPTGGIAMENCQLLHLALYRHTDLQRTTRLHRHRHHQILIYLRGSGKIWTATQTLEISAGTGLLLPAGHEHRFIRQSRRNPLCLAIDFTSKESFPLTIQRPGIFRLTLLRKLINELAHFKESTTLPDRLQRDGIATQLLGLCLGLMSETAMHSHPTHLVLQMEQLIEQSGNTPISLTEAAEKSGYQKDHLNRILKEQSGMTFGQLRSQIRLRRAKAALRKHPTVGEAAASVGFDDVNYFIRWFKKQTGETPGKSAS